MEHKSRAIQREQTHPADAQSHFPGTLPYGANHHFAGRDVGFKSGCRRSA